MSTLIVYLTPAPGGPEYSYVLTQDGQSVGSQGRASAALLPASDEVVAVVDGRALSWQTVDLPKGSVGLRGNSTPRLRSILEGLLEERLLDEPQALHFALAPDARPDAPVCVAVCERAWLKTALQDLESVERAATRIVPEFTPADPAQAGAWQVLGSAERPVLARALAQGVCVLPLDAASVTLALASTDADAAPDLLAEPAVAALAEAAFKRPAQLQQSAQRWLLAAQSGWDLAQFDLISSSGTRSFKKFAQGWQNLRHAPQWRALRWGVALLVVVQLAGLNLLAWQEKAALQAQRAALTGVLTQTFPNVRVVVDAPVQMERELAALRQSTGATSGGDLEALLGAASAVVPASKTVTALEFSAGELRLKGLQLSEAEAASVATPLKAQGYRARVEADALVIQAGAQP
jgi:general secretion pathway protein L